jgi:ribose transport system permease protein
MALRARGVPQFVNGLLIGARFVPVWIAVGLLYLVAAFLVPDSVNSQAFNAVLPFATFLAVAALGQMLVIMTGGIDLSIPGVITMVGTVLLGVSKGADERLVQALIVVLLLAVLVGIVNGLLVGLARLNALVVTLAVGGIVLGLTIGYRGSVPAEAAVPPALASWAANRALGLSYIFWVGVGLSLLLALVLRYTTIGRRFQAVGANPRAAWVAGISVQRYHVLAYGIAGLLYGVVGILLAAFIRNPTLSVGDPYLLGPIAAVVIGGASLAGGLASATATWAAALFLTQLSQMLRVLGLSSALQFVVFGAAIAGGMLISGDRIVGLLSRVLHRSDPPTGSGTTPMEGPEWGTGASRSGREGKPEEQRS